MDQRQLWKILNDAVFPASIKTWILNSEGFGRQTCERRLPLVLSSAKERHTCFPREHRVEHMSKLHQSDGLSILARYTSVAAIAIASSALPLKSGANEQTRDDQVKVERNEEGRTETGGRSALD
jgi:hypothetical protein